VLPPRFIRRLVLAPLVLLLTVGALALSPLLLLAALAVPSRNGRRRATRLFWFGLTWLVLESAALVASLGLWIASGFGGRLHTEASMDRHYALIRWFLGVLFRVALRVFRLRVQIEEPPATAEELGARLTRPVIVLSRHAGPGDSFLLVHHLLSLYRRKPRIVMKAALQYAPSLDVVINRLPHAFVHPRREPAVAAAPGAGPGSGGAGLGGAGSGGAGLGGAGLGGSGSAGSGSAGAGAGGGAAGRAADAAPESPTQSMVITEIRRLASGLGDAGALVIFPEGGNFTPGRWRRGIDRLEQSRRYEDARRARNLAHLLPPRSGGAFAAIDSAPSADVIFVAHTGLDDLITVGDIWRALPMEQVIKAKWWRVPASEVPRDRDDVVRWLYEWWERIDTWIAQNRPVRDGNEFRADGITPRS
jgi:1-acyl-sn-glycerol-3-phosphate acyltransferase